MQPMSKSLFMIKLLEAKQTPFLLTQYHHKKNIKPKTKKIGYNETNLKNITILKTENNSCLFFLTAEHSTRKKTREPVLCNLKWQLTK